MTYFINPIWFYLVNLAQNLRILGFIVITIGVGVLVVAFVTYTDAYVGSVEEIKAKRKWKKALPFLIIGTIFIGFIPDKDTCIEMMVASQVTKENVNYSVETIKDITDYVIEKIKGEK